MKHILYILTAVLLTSCASKVAFTDSLKTKYGISEKTLKKIQFYTSDEIVLVQSDGSSAVYTIDGKILVNNMERQNRIVIPRNTPCTIEETLDSTRVKVSFEYGEGKDLIFGVNSKGLYSLFAKSWQGRDGTVEYNNATYKTDGNSGFAVLTVKLKKLNQYRNKERTVTGRRI